MIIVINNIVNKKMKIILKNIILYKAPILLRKVR